MPNNSNIQGDLIFYRTCLISYVFDSGYICRVSCIFVYKIFKEKAEKNDTMVNKDRRRNDLALDSFSKCHFIGKGDRYYNYPDEIAEGKIVLKEEMIQKARMERDKAELIFGSYRRHLLLPVLFYQYGLWVNYLYLVIVLIWRISAMGAFLSIQNRIEKIFLPFAE